VIDPTALQMVLYVLTGRLERRERGRRLTDDDRRRVGACAHRVAGLGQYGR